MFCDLRPCLGRAWWSGAGGREEGIVRRAARGRRFGGPPGTPRGPLTATTPCLLGLLRKIFSLYVISSCWFVLYVWDASMGDCTWANGHRDLPRSGQRGVQENFRERRRRQGSRAGEGGVGVMAKKQRNSPERAAELYARARMQRERRGWLGMIGAPAGGTGDRAAARARRFYDRYGRWPDGRST